jgi:hypothetical protein
MSNPYLVERILHMVEAVEKDPPHIGVYSTGERIAVALVLDQQSLLDYGSILESVERLGEDWFKAALMAQRMRR